MLIRVHLKYEKSWLFNDQILYVKYLDRNPNLWRENQITAILTSELDDFLKNEILKWNNSNLFEYSAPQENIYIEIFWK